MRLTFGKFVVLVAVIGAAALWYLQQDGRLETHGDWGVYAEARDDGQHCWVEAGTIGASPLFRKFAARVKYSVGPEVLSFLAKGTEFPAPTGWLEIGDTRYKLHFNGPSGWLRDTDEQPAVRTALGANPTASITSGTQGFTFSTTGFDAAVAAAKALCPG